MIVVSKMPQAKGEGEVPSIGKTFKNLFSNKKYMLGVVAQICNVGSQIMCWTYIYQYAEALNIDSAIAANYQFVAFILFLVGRAIGTYILRFISSGKLLMYFSILACILGIGTIAIEGMLGLYCLVAISFTMSIMFPTIYGISLEGLDEEQSKIGAAGLVMAIVGGAFMPGLQGLIIDIDGAGAVSYTHLTLPTIYSV